jgi:hypothetical protein
LIVQSSLTRRNIESRFYRALKRAAKVRPSLRDEEGAHFAPRDEEGAHFALRDEEGAHFDKNLG